MSETATLPDPVRHSWLEVLQDSPVQATVDLLSGYADIFPYSRSDAPDAARMLLGHLAEDDPARSAIAEGIMAWLAEKRSQTLPSDDAMLQDLVRQVSEAFEIISLLELPDPALRLRNGYIRWFDWTSRLELAPSRDARANYLRMLANTQPTVAARVANPDSLAPFWLRVCRESGTTYPENYLQIGLLGLRRLPGAIDRGESPWVAGLAMWAMEQDPADKEFMRRWRPIKSLHPASPRVLRKRVFDVLSQKVFSDAGVETPGWWANDPDFPNHQTSHGRANRLEPPSPDLRQEIVELLHKDAPFHEIDAKLQSMIQKYEHYTALTGDDYYLVRSFCNVGNLLLKHAVDAQLERVQIAQKLARIALGYQPANPLAWGLWRDAVFYSGAYDAAVALGWETVRRFPDNEIMRNELAEILIAGNRLDEAESLLGSSFDMKVANNVSYGILARILANRGDHVGAKAAVGKGLEIFDNAEVLKQWAAMLDAGKAPPLVADSRRKALESVVDDTGDETLSELIRSGHLRRLRQQLENDNSALDELKHILDTDPTFAYAQILAARHGIWQADEDVLPTFAVSFENALANEDIGRLNDLATRMPRYKALVLLARAILGDAEAAVELNEKLHNPAPSDDRAVINMIGNRFLPMLDSVNDNEDIPEAVGRYSDQLRIAIYDVNEAISAPVLLAA